MKIALYIEDGLEQIVLTPESDTERGIVAKLTDNSRDLSICTGEFYSCAGGWVRHKRTYPTMFNGDFLRDESTIIVLRQKKAEQPA